MVGDRMEEPRARRVGTPNPFGVLALVVCALAVGSCRPEISPDSPLGARVSLVGAGAGFPAMLCQSWAIARLAAAHAQINHPRS